MLERDQMTVGQLRPKSIALACRDDDQFRQDGVQCGTHISRPAAAVEQNGPGPNPEKAVIRDDSCGRVLGDQQNRIARGNAKLGKGRHCNGHQSTQLGPRQRPLVVDQPNRIRAERGRGFQAVAECTVVPVPLSDIQQGSIRRVAGGARGGWRLVQEPSPGRSFVHPVSLLSALPPCEILAQFLY